VSTQRTGWSWPLFAWGVAVGLFGLVVVFGLFSVVRRRSTVSDEQQTKIRHRLVIYSGLWLALGLIFGSASAAFGHAWIDLVATVYVVVLLTGGAVVLSRHVRKLRTR
jgi:hypothetical protein